MRLSFEWIILENFRSFAQPTELVLSDLPYGAFFVHGENNASPQLGSNGAGKSTIFDAIMWALSGKTLRGLRSTDVRTWGAKGPTRVVLAIKVDSMRHVITRQSNPNVLDLDGREVSDVEIEKLLGIPISIIPHTILIGQTGDLFFDLPPRAKMQLFSDVLKLDRWDHRADIAKAKADDYASESDTLTGAITHLRQALVGYEANYKRVNDAREKYDSDRATALEQANTLFKEADKRLQVLLTEQGKGTLMVDGAETELKAIDDELVELRKAIRKRDALIKERAVDIASREVRINSYQVMLKGYKDQKCPTCGQSMHEANNKKKISDLQAKIDDEQTSLYDIMLKRDANERKRETLSKRVESLEEAKARFSAQLAEGESIIRQHANEAAELKARKAACEREVIALRKADNPYADQAEAIKRQLRKAQDDYDEKEDRLTRLGARIKRYRYWQKGFREIKLYVIDTILEELQFTANAMLDDFGMSDWSITFDVEKETQSGSVSRGLNILIRSPHNEKQVKWEVWSGGESQRLRLIGALALAEVLLNHAGVVPDLEVLDEPTRGLSANGARDLCDFLAARAQRLKRRVFLIDHLSRESARFKGRLSVVRNRKGSKLDTSALPSLNSRR